MLAMGMMLGGLPVYTVTLSSNGGTWQKSVDGTSIPSSVPVLLVLRISSAIERQSSSTSLGAIHLDGLANGSFVDLINLGYAIGKGGNAGAGGSDSPGVNGQAGGPAIRANFNGTLRVTNSSGRIWGGGGGGGGGGQSLAEGSGGGGGAGGGSGGSGAESGTAGTTGSAGTPGVGGTTNADGGDGGAYGVAGSNGQSSGFAGGSGGAAGYAILHDAGTTVVFVAGSGSPNVKGSIGS
ncbi:hypothetical protein [Nitrospira sp. BLG_2]|uniref:hypothetical protein n=1 Tax=Nitrospira sp. BLG_2 TaxID=3397507 RepID=UPI003B9C6B51